MRSRHTVDVSRAPLLLNPHSLPAPTTTLQPLPRPRNTVNITRIETDPAKASLATFPAKPSFTTLPMITESCFCDGMREISGGVYEDGSHKSVRRLKAN